MCGAARAALRLTKAATIRRRLCGLSTFSARPSPNVVRGVPKVPPPGTSEVVGGKGSVNGVDAMRKSRCIPKRETGVYDLYDEYPGSDGAGVKIAVMDTGCCLQAAGLSGTTSDGKTPKYLDFVDCTGDGDVPMDKEADFDHANSTSVAGPSGRNLALGEWAKDAKKLRLGAVRLFELLPWSVERRVKRERKEAFLARHEALVSDTQAKLDGLASKDADDDEAKKATEKEKKELKLMLEQLKSVAEGYEDFGPLMDIVMFEDDGTWKAVIDLEAKGDLTNATPMAPFAHARQAGELGFGTHVSFCVQVYDDGRTLSIVTDAGSHGTHVAGIAAACFDSDEEDDDDRNGMAPGAQVLALKIGDGRLGSTETGTGLIRGLIAAKRHGCDLVNLSYGEPTWQPDAGRVSEVFAKAVHDWGMTVFVAAMNDGPALSTLGCPGSLTAPITVGAYVSPEMMAEQYSTLPPSSDDAPLEGASYYFSSRGPTPDGLLPDVCGPGGAIAPIPRHSLQGKNQYHGTSMASPNVCGTAASILSAVRQKGVECGPAELKRAMVNTAQRRGIVEPFSQGAGVVSALECAEYIVANHGKDGQDVAIDVTVPARDNARGIYLRDEIELESSLDFGVLVKPRFSHANQRTADEMDELLGLELDLLLNSSAEWVKCPDGMTLLSAQERNGQTFTVRLNPRGLGPGVHYATVDAIDVSDPARGALFSLPITVVIPHSRFVSAEKPKFALSEQESFGLKENGLDYTSTYQLSPGDVSRRFITVPQAAEWVTIKLRSSSPDPLGAAPRVYVHAVPFARGDLHFDMIHLQRVYRVRDGVEEEYHLRVKGGSTLELCLQLLWLANPSPASVAADIEFHSLNSRSPTLVSSQPATISAAREFARLGVGTPLRAEKLNPECNLNSVLRTLRPTECDVQLGSVERDSEPLSDAEVASNPDKISSPIYEMRGKYTFKIEGDKAIEVLPSFPSLFSQLYDSPVDSQLWALEDSSGQVLEYGSCMHPANAVSLKKGDYTIKLLLRHPNRYSLESLKDIPCEIKLKLPSALSCGLYNQMDKASTPGIKDDGRSPLGAKLLPKGSHQDIYVSRPTDALPTWVTPGDVLEGSLVLDKDRQGVTSMKVLYVAPPKPQAKDAKKDESGSKDKKEDSLDDIVFKAKLGYLATLRTKNSTSYQEVADQLKAEKPTSVPLLSELLNFALETSKPETVTNEDEWRLNEVGLVHDSLMKAIDEASLAKYFGVNAPDNDELEDDEEAKTLNKEMTEQRSALQKILLARVTLAGKVADVDESGTDAFDQAVKEMKKWYSVDKAKDDEEKIKLSINLAKHARLCQKKNALAISILLKAKKDFTGKNLKQIDEELLKVYESIAGMDHMSENLKEGMQCRYPVLKRSV